MTAIVVSMVLGSVIVIGLGIFLDMLFSSLFDGT